MRRRGLAQKNRLLHRRRNFYSTRNYDRVCVSGAPHPAPAFVLGAVAAATGSVLIRKRGKHTSSHDPTCMTHTHTHSHTLTHTHENAPFLFSESSFVPLPKRIALVPQSYRNLQVNSSGGFCPQLTPLS